MGTRQRIWLDAAVVPTSPRAPFSWCCSPTPQTFQPMGFLLTSRRWVTWHHGVCSRAWV